MLFKKTKELETPHTALFKGKEQISTYLKNKSILDSTVEDVEDISEKKPKVLFKVKSNSSKTTPKTVQDSKKNIDFKCYLRLQQEDKFYFVKLAKDHFEIDFEAPVKNLKELKFDIFFNKNSKVLEIFKFENSKEDAVYLYKDPFDNEIKLTSEVEDLKLKLGSSFEILDGFKKVFENKNTLKIEKPFYLMIVLLSLNLAIVPQVINTNSASKNNLILISKEAEKPFVDNSFELKPSFKILEAIWTPGLTYKAQISKKELVLTLENSPGLSSRMPSNCLLKEKESLYEKIHCSY